MSRSTHTEGTLTVEIWRHLCPYCDKWHVHEDNGNETEISLPEETGDHWGEETSQAGELVIFHETETTPDTSGDRDTPNAPADVETTLVRAEVNGQRLPQELAEQLFSIFEDRIQDSLS